MKHAILLYEMTLKNKSQHMCLQPLGKNGFQLLLACYNNLGHAQRFMECPPRANVCFRALLALLMWAVVNKVGSVACIDSYWDTVQHLLIKPTVTAAAA